CRTIVVQTAVPNSVLEVEQMFELSVERFDAHVAASIERAAPTRAKELATVVTQAAMMLTEARFPVVRLTRALRLRARNFGTEKPATRATAAAPFDCLAHRVAVVASIGQDKFGRPRQIRQLLQNRFLLRAAGGIERCCQRPNHALARRRDRRFVSVALNPTVILRVS